MSENKIKLDVNAEVTSRLKFEPSPINKNLCIGQLESVEITESVIDADSEWEYKGLTVPRIAFHFTNFKLSVEDPDRFFTHSELPIARIKKDGTPIKDSDYVNMITELWKRIKHIHNAYKKAKSPNYRPITVIPDFTTDTTSTPETRLAEFKEFFNIIFNSFKGVGEEKPIWLDVNGKSIVAAMKLIATPTRDGRSMYLAFPHYVTEGFIEPYLTKDGKIDTTLRFRPSESTELKAATMPAAMVAGGNMEAEVDDPVRQALLKGKKSE